MVFSCCMVCGQTLACVAGILMRLAALQYYMCVVFAASVVLLLLLLLLLWLPGCKLVLPPYLASLHSSAAGQSTTLKA
jgi:hypothetical protein